MPGSDRVICQSWATRFGAEGVLPSSHELPRCQLVGIFPRRAGGGIYESLSNPRRKKRSKKKTLLGATRSESIVVQSIDHLMDLPKCRAVGAIELARADPFA